MYTLGRKTEMDLFQLNISEIDAAKIPGYRRGAYGVAKTFGIEYKKNVNSLSHFALVLHKENTYPYDTLVEVLYKPTVHWDGKMDDIVSISPKVWKKTCSKNSYFQNMVELDGRMFIRGLAWGIPNTGYPSYELCEKTNAFIFLKDYGSALATLMKYPNVVHSIEDGTELNDKVSSVLLFIGEIVGIGVNAMGITNCQDRIACLLDDIKEEEESFCSVNQRYLQAIETLAKYGITVNKKK